MLSLVTGITDQQAVDADAELIGQLLARPFEEVIIDLSGGDGVNQGQHGVALDTLAVEEDFPHAARRAKHDQAIGFQEFGQR